MSLSWPLGVGSPAAAGRASAMHIIDDLRNNVKAKIGYNGGHLPGREWERIGYRAGALDGCPNTEEMACD
ncbi:hypothetical protein OS128_05780 [Corynebacterium sp. P5848]|uniref:hypothetical protein n=1 Tax=Corynebacterium marambiense TaxID=2765364 RepID=UPI002260DC01|nr:hypothetical protein [Corynebacterium marambiense]MCX7542419.1 hypothetical protein [Corynebacterium marambiense]